MRKVQGIIIPTILFAVVLLWPLLSCAGAKITVAAANSTCPALKKAGDIFMSQHGVTIEYICKSSGVLAKGLESGHITADYYISASQKWVDYLVAAGLVDPLTVKNLWSNSIIAAAAKNSTLELQSWDELATAKVTTIFVGDPSTTPLGRQFKNAMVARGLWQAIRPKIVAQRHISMARAALSTANVGTIGILFPTSLDSNLKPLLAMPTEWHEPIRYYGGPLAGSTNKEDTALFDTFLRGVEVNKIFRQQGYQIVP